MEHQKILNLSNKANNSKFVMRKWNSANIKFSVLILLQYNLFLNAIKLKKV